MITLEDLLFITNEGNTVKLVNSDTQEEIITFEVGDYEFTDTADEVNDYLEATVMDIVAGNNILIVDIDI